MNTKSTLNVFLKNIFCKLSVFNAFVLIWAIWFEGQKLYEPLPYGVLPGYIYKNPMDDTIFNMVVFTLCVNIIAILWKCWNEKMQKTCLELALFLYLLVVGICMTATFIHVVSASSESVINECNLVYAPLIKMMGKKQVETLFPVRTLLTALYAVLYSVTYIYIRYNSKRMKTDTP